MRSRNPGCVTWPRNSFVFRNPAFVASLATVAVAVVTLLVTVTRTWPERFVMVQGILVLASSGHDFERGITVAASIGLLIIARGMARRQRRAWLAAIVLLCGIIAATVRDGDLDLALPALVLLGALFLLHAQFYAATEATRLRSTLGVALTAAIALYAYGLGAIYWHAAARHETVAIGVALARVTLGLVGYDAQSPATRFSHALTVTLAIAAIGTALIVVSWLLRAPLSGVSTDARDRATVRRLVSQAGSDTLAYFALRRDKHYFINTQRSAFLAYRSVGGIALVSGDPIGDRAAFAELVSSFAAHCRRHSWRLAVIGVAPDSRPLWQALGLKTVPVGEEAIVRTAEFSLEGRSIRKVRQSVHRLERLGYRAQVLLADAVSEPLWRDIARVSAAWSGGVPERGFSMALDDMRGVERGDCLFVLGFKATGELAGYLHLAPVPATGDLSLAAMRRLADVPNGFTEWLVCAVIGWGRQQGIERISLNFAAFGGLLRAEDAAPPARLARYALRYADRFFQLERLLQFNAKFYPEWLPRYLAVERYTDIPVASLVLLTLEKLVRWPGPVQRLWLRL